MRYQGKITNWKDDQGFGFVTQNGGGEKAFVHIKSFSVHSRRPTDGDLITYELITDEKRRLRADNIRFVEKQPNSSAQHKSKPFSTIFTVAFCCFLIFLVFIGKLPFTVLGIYFAASLIAFLSYAIDKSAAQNNNWRTQERTLHLFGLIGGWPGALFAQKTLHHKSKKQEFQTVFWTTVIINCCIVGWLLTKSGAAFMITIF